MPDRPQSLLIIDDESDVHYSFERLLKKEGLRIVSADNPKDGLALMEKERPDVIVMDIRMGKENGLDTLREIRAVNPRQLVVMMTAYGTSQTAIEAMKLGAFDYVLKPFDIPELIALLRRALSAAREMNSDAPSAVKTLAVSEIESGAGIIGQSAGMQAVYKLVGQVAPTDATVLITGESGTGKELIARAIVDNSRRAKRPFITINCAAIPENLLESELFGHEKGSFTGAMAQRIGKFEQCDGGTLFLDEIGEMPLPIQAKLLRVIQEGEFTRVGGNKSLQTNVRLIAATNRDLLSACRNREFREDLYYRLNVFRIHLPPLRDRLNDIPRMVAHFMDKWRKHHPDGPEKFANEAMAMLCAYHFPGNVRELENIIQRAMVLANGDTITVADLPRDVTLQQAGSSETAAAPASAGCDVLDTLFDRNEEELEQAGGLLAWVERELINRAVDRCEGNQARAAKLLGITRTTLRSRLQKLEKQ